MAERERLTEDAIRIARSIKKFAEDRGWDSGEYRYSIRFNLDWGIIHVLVRSDKIKDTDWREISNSVYAEMEQDMLDNAELYSAIGFVAVPLDFPGPDVNQWAGPNYVEFDESILNSASPLPAHSSPNL